MKSCECPEYFKKLKRQDHYDFCPMYQITPMKEIEIISEHGERYRDDIERIKRILIEKGYNATLMQAEILWDRYSDSMAAGWMMLPEDDEEVFDSIVHYLNN